MLSLRSHTAPSDDDIIQWSLDNPGFRFEYVNGKTIVSPTTAKSGQRTSKLNQKLGIWATAHGYQSFGSSTLLTFGDLKVSPDEVLLQTEKFSALSEEEQDKPLSLPPDITVEIISKSQQYGQNRDEVQMKCAAMDGAGVGYVVMLDPYAKLRADRVTTWGTRPSGFPTVWDDILDT